MSDQFVEVTLQGVNLTKYPGKPLTAYYIGKNEIEGQYGEEIHHLFRKEDGTDLKIYGFTTLNRKLEAIPFGTLVRMTYTGTETVKTKFGMRETHQVKVEANHSKRVADILGSSSPKPVKNEAVEPVEKDEENNDLPW